MLIAEIPKSTVEAPATLLNDPVVTEVVSAWDAGANVEKAIRTPTIPPKDPVFISINPIVS